MGGAGGDGGGGGGVGGLPHSVQGKPSRNPILDMVKKALIKNTFELN